MVLSSLRPSLAVFWAVLCVSFTFLAGQNFVLLSAAAVLSPSGLHALVFSKGML